MPEDTPPEKTANVWRYAMARRAHVVIDAEEYFRHMHEAMQKARQRIFLIGWDVDSRIRLLREENTSCPQRLGRFILHLVKRSPGLEIRILKWYFGAVKLLFRGSMIFDLLRWGMNRSIDFKLDSAHPTGCSHHQKIVVIDDSLAACGGIDMTSERWDTPEHLDHDERRKRFGSGYYEPFHDITMLMEGEIATALEELGRQRWIQAGGRPLEPCQPRTDSLWPEKLQAEFENVEIGIARTRAPYQELEGIHEVEDLFVEQIARAKKFLYAENQYFSSRRIAEAIARKLSEPDPPEIVLVNPESASGWLEQAAMDGARIQLLHAIGKKDPANRFRIYIPRTAGGKGIYVHAKLMIVDDEILRIGSANMNNRSMGLDSECDVFIDTRRPANRHAGEAITRIRHKLLAEHCGLRVEEVAELEEKHGSMTDMIQALPRNGKHLSLLELQPLSETEMAVAENALLDPERPEEMFEPIQQRRGLFRRGGILRRPRKKEIQEK